MTESARAGLAAASVCIAILLYTWACSSAANPLPLRYRNPGTTMAYDHVEVVAPGLPAPILAPSTCAPGATCQVVVGMPPGNYPGLQLRARSAARVSPPSNGVDVTIPVPTPCLFDSDGNGILTATDFAAFLASYDRQHWTAGDFAVFLSRFGRPCA